MMYAPEPIDKKEYTRKNDRAYSRMAGLYDLAVRIFPIWRRWIGRAVPFIRGPRVLETSFGTGYLLTQYAGSFDTCGIDYNWALTQTARRNLARSGTPASLQLADIENLPFRSAVFDTVVNTMAFTGYPDGYRALAEIRRVLKPDGQFVLVDVGYPRDGNRAGMKIAQIWSAAGDIIRDMAELFAQTGFRFEEEEIGGFGTVHLYVATKT